MTDFYRSSSSGISYYSGTTGSEPNMRQELINFFDGYNPEIGKAQDGLIRRMNRDNDGNLIPCNCVDSLTNEPDKDRFCPVCMGSGYLWTEENIQFYRILEDSDVDNAIRNRAKPQGLINIPYVVFYIRYDSGITKDDKIIRLALDNDGTVTVPYRRVGIYRINSLWDYRADNGKLEYWKLFTHLEDVKYLNSPGYGNI